MKFRAQPDTANIQHDGIVYKPNADGIVDLPLEVGQLLSLQSAEPEGKVTPPAPERSADGPTPFEYVSRGYKADTYPPQHYAAKNNDGTIVDDDTGRALAIAAAAQLDAERVAQQQLKDTAEPILGGTVAEVVAEVAKLGDVDLDLLKRAEVVGRNRKGVLSAIDARVAELAPK